MKAAKNDRKSPSAEHTHELAVVTGASTGIGFELARQFALNGFDLIIASENQERIEAAAEELRAFGTSVQPYHLDLATEEGVDRLFARIDETGRGLDAIAINAGIGVGGAAFAETSWEKERNLLLLNVVHTAYTAKLAVRKMLAQGEGRILFTASISSLMPGGYEAVYNASKAFVYSLANGIRDELKDSGITVTALLPGPTDTNFFHRGGMDDTKVGSEMKYENDPATVARQGFEALMAGKNEVVGGSLKTKAQAAAARVLPVAMATKMHSSMSEPGSASKH